MTEFYEIVVLFKKLTFIKTSTYNGKQPCIDYKASCLFDLETVPRVYLDF